MESCGHSSEFRICDMCRDQWMCELQNKLQTDDSLEYFINYRWDYLSDTDPVEEWTEWLNRRKPKDSKERKFAFITIQDFQRRMCDVDKLKQFMSSISYMYEMGEWVIESGKNPSKDEYNLHIHMLVRIRPQVKNHKKVLDIKWRKHFNTSLYDSDYYLIKQHRDSPAMPSYDEWLAEKRSYFTNTVEGKGSHINSEDLGLRGVWGS